MTTTLTEAQEEALVLIGHDEADCLDKGHQGAVDGLFSDGLVTFTADRPVLTAAGRAVFDRLLLD